MLTCYKTTFERQFTYSLQVQIKNHKDKFSFEATKHKITELHWKTRTCSGNFIQITDENI